MDELVELVLRSDRLFYVGTATFVGTLVLTLIAFTVAARFAAAIAGTQERFHKASRAFFFSVTAIVFVAGIATTAVVFNEQIKVGDAAQRYMEGPFVKELGYVRLEPVDDREVSNLARGGKVTFMAEAQDGRLVPLEVSIADDKVTIEEGALPEAVS